MKYKYSEKYQEAAILDHKGIYGAHAGEKLLKHLKSLNKPILSIIIKHEGRLISYNYNNRIQYGKAGLIGFDGFGTACLGYENNYSDVVNRYKIKLI